MPLAVEASREKWNYEEEEGRLEKYQEYDSFYHGDHPSLIAEKFKTVLAERLGIVDNFCSLIVDKGTSFLVGKPLRFSVEGSPEIEEWLKKVWQQNKMRSQMLKAQRTNGTKGDVFLKPWFNADDKKVLIRVLRPDIVFPGYSEEDYEEMLSCEIKFPIVREEVEYTFIQVWKPETIVEYEAAKDAIEWTFLREIPNKYGIMPIHVRNKILDKPFGESDLEDVIPLQKAFNKVLTDIMKISEDQAFTHMYATGVREGEEGNLEHGPGKLWVFRSPDAKVGAIEPANIEQLLKFLDLLADEIAHKGRVPEFKMTTVVKDISGIALRMMYSDMIERTEERVTLWSDALRQLFLDLVQIGIKEGLIKGLRSFSEDEFDLKIIFDIALPVDKKERVEWIEKEVDLALKSRKTAMKEIGIDDVDKELEKIKEEQEDEYAARAVAEAAAATKGAGELETEAAGGVT